MEAAQVLAVDALNAAMEAKTLIADQKGTLKIPNKIFSGRASEAVNKSLLNRTDVFLIITRS